MSETTEERLAALVHEPWSLQMPWLVQGTTTRGRETDLFDLGVFAGASPGDRVRGNWTRLMERVGLGSVVLARQVHGADVRVQGSRPMGLHTADVCDGHATREAGLLLAVTVADCVPVFMVAPETRAVAVVHAGWRGAAAGVFERGLSALVGDLGASVEEMQIHLGPSICGRCYEVGPEVFRALHQPVPESPEPIDLRAVLVRRAAAAGVPRSNVSISEHCTRCTRSALFSHRGGDGERQVGFIGIRV